MKLPKIFNELKRRDVFRVATAYAVSSWLIIQVVVSTFPYIGIPDIWITIIIVLLIIGFPVAIMIGWIYESTPEGIRKTGVIDVSEEFEENSERKLNRLIIGVLAIVILFMAVERLFFADSALIERDTLSVQTASIAVLPFADMSEDKDQEYFTDGLTEELLNVLAKVEELQVAGRTSSFQYKGQNIDLREVGESLGVEHVLEGSIRKFGDQIRITAQLIKVDDGFHMWSETYDRAYSASELFQIQDEISQKVLQELQIRLLPEKEEQLSKQLTSNTEAYDLYLKANQLLVNRKADEIQEAIDLFGLAIEADDEFAAAYARRAIAYQLLSDYGNINRDEMLKIMRQNIDLALILDPELGWAYAALGSYYLYLDNHFEAHVALNKAYEIMPGDPEIMLLYSEVVHDWDETVELINRAYERDPYNAITISKKARNLYGDDKFDEAFKLMEKNIEFNPDNSLALSLKAEFIRDQPFGRLDEAFILAYQAYQLEPGNLTYIDDLATMSFDLGFFFLVEQMRDEVAAKFPNNESLLNIDYYYYFYKNQYDSSRIIHERAIEFNDMEFGDLQLLDFTLKLYLLAGWYGDAEQYISEYFPDILLLENLEEYYTIDLAFSSILFEKLGKAELSESLALAACNEATSYLTQDGDIKKELTFYLFEYMDCVAVNKDKDLLLDIIEEIYFGRHSKANVYTFIDTRPTFDFIRNEPEYRALRERIEADRISMRNNAISWLQERGEWQADWEIYIPNY